MSARASSDKATLSSPLISLNRFNSRDTNIRPWPTHFVIKCNFPSSTCNLCLLVDCFTNHISTSLLISCKRIKQYSQDCTAGCTQDCRLHPRLHCTLQAHTPSSATHPTLMRWPSGPLTCMLVPACTYLHAPAPAPAPACTCMLVPACTYLHTCACWSTALPTTSLLPCWSLAIVSNNIPKTALQAAPKTAGCTQDCTAHCRLTRLRVRLIQP